MNEPNPESNFQPNLEPKLEPNFEPQPPELELGLEIPVAEAAPIVQVDAQPAGSAASEGANELLGLPLQFLNQLLQKFGASKLDNLSDWLPALRLLAIALASGIALKITGSTLGAINEIPLLGGLLELLGLVALLNFLARNALKQQKRAELFSRIRQLKKDFMD